MLSLERLGAVFHEITTPLSLTPRKFNLDKRVSDGVAVVVVVVILVILLMMIASVVREGVAQFRVRITISFRLLLVVDWVGVSD